MEHSLRIDKWLWSVRIFRTRSLAADACRAGRVKIVDQPVKPSHEVKIGETITVLMPPVTKTVRVIGHTISRVSAKLVPDFMEDLTPEAEYQKLKRTFESNFEFRERGTGRPTKRERREIEFLKKYLDK